MSIRRHLLEMPTVTKSCVCGSLKLRQHNIAGKKHNDLSRIRFGVSLLVIMCKT